MQALLALWLSRAGAGPLREYALDLLAQFDAEPRVARPVEPSEQALVEPLSARELEVLHLIALGKTNPEIAEQLVVAPGTVKAHASHIYTKLDVTNRTEAVARARQLGLLT
jgi:LuxR family maltose regulon positive regulatory protein